MTALPRLPRACAGPGRRRHARGLAIVETAITLPLLLLLALGIVEFGRAMFQYVTLTAATRESARYLATHAIDGSTGVIHIDPALTTETRNMAVFGNPVGTGEPVLPEFAVDAVTITSNATTNDVAVATSYTYHPIIGAQLPTFGLGQPISLQLALRAEVSLRAL